jgi:hypothetical protein
MNGKHRRKSLQDELLNIRKSTQIDVDVDYCHAFMAALSGRL